MHMHLVLKMKHSNRLQDALTSNRHMSTAVPKVTSAAGSTAPATAQLALILALKLGIALLTQTPLLDLGLAGVQRISVNRRNANWQSRIGMLGFTLSFVVAALATF